MIRLLFTVSCMLFLSLLLRASPEKETVATVTYQPSNELFANPERGFYHHTDTLDGEVAHEGHPYVSLDLDDLHQEHRQGKDITLILRVFYLDGFVDTSPDCLDGSSSCAAIDITQAYLDKMQADFDAIRAAGIKAIVRFAYENHLDQDPNCSPDEWCPIPPYRDAPKESVLAHLEQLQPVLQANRDVIVAVQAGFIGTWGEWYYTDHFVDNPNDPGTVTEENYDERGEVLTATLAAISAERMVQVRTPLFKQRIFRPGNPLGAALRLRTGHHNDCFLADESDFGTYQNIAQEKVYLAQDTKHVPVGGETCNDLLSNVWYSPTLQMPGEPPGGWVRSEDGPELPYPPSEWDADIRSLCPTALQELQRFHWSYLNIDYNRDVIGKWDTGVLPHDCLDNIQRRLGYRFELIRGVYPTEVQAGGEVSMTLVLTNTGWAAPFNERPVELLLRRDKNVYTVTLPKAVADPRLWLLEEVEAYTINATICTPDNLPSGDYELLLYLPDAAESLAGRPEYAIRLANRNVWEATTGYNKLNHKVKVTKASAGVECDSSLVFETINLN